MASRTFAPFAKHLHFGAYINIPFRRYASTTASNASKQASRMERINARLPRFLQKYTRPLTSAPVTHITAFLVLHELTAIVPLFGLAGLFHYTEWLPPFISEWQWFAEGMRRFGNYLRKKGWLKEADDAEEAQKPWYKRSGRFWSHGEKGSRIVVEFAAAYALTKVLLPVRLIFSVWGTPLFARLFIAPPIRVIGQMFSKRSPVTASKQLPAGAGTNAVGGGVIKQSTK